MIDGRLKELVALRMQQAEETLREAQVLLAERAPRGAVSRAYDAMFYAVLALLATKGLGSSKHSGTIALFDREFVKPGDLAKELSRSLHMAFERRQQADYGELTRLDEMIVVRGIEEAETFVRGVAAYMGAKGFLVVE
ncbi:MAG: HEPN domain-containing protein [Sedimentisphaerales bacterium]|nr:HEPN domain-containing protein [Sedimentisphaerales bacterium]HNY79687.1 HEPN domain-containing protein [Sedimentisphaerales bacterium]HOC64806.1 HEPN domain-containing protein [Sedimentisphaerales bacterium]HOH65676.1 HEPN domain-containing protein [Sedimentisphaerales bacterium]HPY50130.1 HEPN domain-containing protein [Sedimentisphaerales bacterium]